MKRLMPLLAFTIILIGAGVLVFQDTDHTNDQVKQLPSIIELITEEGEPTTGPKMTGAQLAFLQNYEMTKDPDLGYPPMQRKIEAYAAVQSSLRNQLVSESAIPGVQWTERGSDNIGGRTRAILFNPADPESKGVWAGATGGGLWYNTDITDEMSKWQKVTGLMDNLAISDIIYDPANINIMYVSTGLAFSGIAVGDGIWKSTDSGVTWNQLPNTSDNAFRAVQDIMITQSGTLLAATINGLMRSTDGGDTWNTIRTGDFADLEEAINGDIYASTGVNGDGLLFKSIDDGLTLADITPRSDGDRIEIATAPSNANVVYAVAQGGGGDQDVRWFVRSDDGGATWTDLTIPLQINNDCSQGPDHFTRGQAFFNLILAVHPLNEDIVLAGGIDVHRSMNGGEDWEGVSYWTGNGCEDFVHADQHQIVFRPNLPNEAVFGHDGGLSYSPNVGNAANPDFETRVNGYNTTMFYSIAMTNQPGSNIMLAGAQDNGTLRFTEPGVNSTRQVFGGDGTLSFIDQTNPNIHITAFVFNFVVWSNNAGRSFQILNNDQNSGRFINPADYDDQRGNYFSAGDANQIKRIQGIKNNPQAQETITINLDNRVITHIEVSPNVEKRLFVGASNGNIYRIDSTHLDQMVVTPLNGSFSGIPGNFVSGIDIGATDNQIAITYSEFGRTSVYETTNGGSIWSNKEGNLPDIPVRDILYNPDNRNQVLIATELGVWSTTEFSNPNPNWEATNAGLASVRADRLEYRATDKMVAVATHGRGIFTSNVFTEISIADFSVPSTVGYAGVPVQFTDASTNAEGDFAWNFGDGNTSTEQNPAYTYTEPGTYSVSLAINGGTDTETRNDFITILPLRSLPYTLEDGGDFETDNGHFTAQSILHDVNLWERGTPTGTLNQPSSGNNAWKTSLSSTIPNLGFDHQSALYTPAFDLTDPNRDYTLKFRRSGATQFAVGPIGMYIQYSLDAGSTWFTLGSSFDEAGQVNWYDRGPNRGSFLVGSIAEDQMGWAESGAPVVNIDTQIKLNEFIGNENVSFRFITGVTSIFNNGYDQDGFMIDDFEITATAPTADFTSDRTVIPENGSIQFTYTSNGADTFSWDFGDGNTSSEENPSHTYTTSGSYTVALTITVGGSSVTETKTDFITVLPSVRPPYVLEDGGNFEVNQSNFSADSEGGTPFELGTSSIAGKDGTSSGSFAWVTGLDAPNYASDSRSSLLTPSFILDQPLEYTLEFKANFSLEDAFDGFIVEYSTDLGETFTTLNSNVEDGWYTQTASNNSPFGAGNPIFTGDTGGSFQTFSTDITSLFPNDNVLFRFLFLSDGSVEEAGVALDDFQIIAQTPAAPEADFSIAGTTGCSGQSVVFTSTSTGSISEYEWNFGANATPAMATGQGPHTVTYTGTGLSSPSLTVRNNLGTSDTETKTDLISTSPTHTPTITRGTTTNPEEALLTASAGTAYQWFRDGTILNGETNQSLTTTEDGLYTVDVTIDNCTARSSAFNLSIIVTSIEDNTFDATVDIFPNPVQDELNISIINEVRGTHSFSFYSYDGRLISTENKEKDEREATFTFDVSLMPQGNFLVQIVSPAGTTTRKIIKQ